MQLSLSKDLHRIISTPTLQFNTNNLPGLSLNFVEGSRLNFKIMCNSLTSWNHSWKDFIYPWVKEALKRQRVYLKLTTNNQFTVIKLMRTSYRKEEICRGLARLNHYFYPNNFIIDRRHRYQGTHLLKALFILADKITIHMEKHNLLTV